MKINERFSNVLNTFAKEYGWKTTIQMRKALNRASPSARYTVGNTTWRAAMLLKILNHETFSVSSGLMNKKSKYYNNTP